MIYRIHGAEVSLGQWQAWNRKFQRCLWLAENAVTHDMIGEFMRKNFPWFYN